MIDELLREPKTDSPVYTYLNGLIPPSLVEKVAEAVAQVGETLEAAGRSIAVAAPEAAAPRDMAVDPTLSRLVEMGEQAIKGGDFAGAKGMFGAALGVCKSMQSPDGSVHREDPYLVQRLALATYKAKQPDDASAVRALHDALEVLGPLNPEVSNDPETVGLAGAIEKRLFEKGQGAGHLAHAIRYYTRGYYLRDDSYNGINLAYLRDVRADSPLDPTDADRIADLVFANRIRSEVLALCDRELEACRKSKEQAEQTRARAVQPGAAGLWETQRESDWERSYWCLATKAEAHFGLGEMANYEMTRSQAMALDPAPAPWMIDSFTSQLGKLRSLLEKHGHLLDPPWPADVSALSRAD